MDWAQIQNFMKLTPEYVSLGPESIPRANVVTISKILPLTKFEPKNFGNGNTVNVQNPKLSGYRTFTIFAFMNQFQATDNHFFQATSKCR